MKRKGFIISALVAAVCLGVAAAGGIVLAHTAPAVHSQQPVQSQAQPGGPPSSKGIADDFLNLLAQNLHIDRQTLNNALKQSGDQEVDKQIASGAICADRGQQIKQRIDNGQFPFAAGKLRGGKDNAELDACGPRGAVASALGMSPSELKQALQSGQTLTQIAQSHDKSLDDVRNAAGASVKSCLDQQVSSGKLSQQQEDHILKRIQNNKLPGERAS